MTDELPTLPTRWSMLDRLQGPDRDHAWHWLQKTYAWFVNDFVRRHLTGERLQRAVDDFWGYLFQSRVFERADRNRRFRAFLIGTLQRYLRSFGRADFFAQEPATAEGGGDAREPAFVETTIDQEDTRAWATSTLHSALANLDDEHPTDAAILREFYGLLPDTTASAGGEPGTVRRIAERLGKKPNAVHQALFRARERLREHFVDIVRQTVTTQAELEDELIVLFATLEQTRPGLFEA